MKFMINQWLQKPLVGFSFVLFENKKRPFRTFCVLMCCLIQASNLFAQTLKVLPERPKPGDRLTINYYPQGGTLEKEQDISCKALLVNDLLSEQVNITLKKSGDAFTATLLTAKGSEFVALKFFSGKISDEKSVNYQVLFYTANEPVVGARCAQAKLLTDENDMHFYGFKTPDYLQAFELLKQEKRSSIEDRHQIPIIRAYYSCMFSINPALAEKEAIAYLANLDQKNKTEQFYIMNFWLYRILNKQDLSQKYLAELKVNFPNSPMFFTQRYSAIESAKTAQEMEEMVKKLVNDYQNSEVGKSILADFMPALHRKVSKAYGKDLNLEKFYFYLKKDTSYIYKSITANEVARSLSLKNTLLAEAEQISLLSLNYLDSIPSDENKQTVNNVRANNVKTYGYILYQNGKYKDALTLLEKAIASDGEKDSQLQTYYGFALAKNKQFERALPMLEAAISSGDTDETLANVFKETYFALGKTSKSYEARLAELFKTADKNGKLELKKTIINEPMPNFTLVDAKGKKVTLADFKGKTMVIDFWAMWCFPCKQSFPGMQKLVNKYAGKDVAFLFVNTLEKNQNGLTTSVVQYMKENKYSFNVLFDRPKKDNPALFELFSSLNLKSLPTKLVVDKFGNIRFKSIGYLGSDEAVVKELSDQIETVK